MVDKETCPYCQSHGLVFVPIDENYGERRCASCGAVHSVMQIEDHAELARLRAELEHARNSLANTIDTCNAWTDKYTERNAEAMALRAALAEAERERDEARAALEILRNSTVAMPAWVCPKCGRSHPMIESGCPCIYDNIKITTGTVSTPRRIEPRFDDERDQAGKDADNG